MKKRLIVVSVYLSVFLFILGCAQTKLTDYQARSVDEKNIIDVVLEEQKALDNNDLVKLMACYHDDATIMLHFVGRYSPKVSKRQWEEYLKDDGWGAYGKKILFISSITIRGDRATLKCSSQAPATMNRHTYNLIKEDEQWYIISYDWTF